MKALLHVHSSYSYDAEPTLEQLCAWGESRELDFIFLSEHSNDFDHDKMKRFVAHCDALEGRACRLVPGLEFPVEGGFHLLGYNLRAFAPLTKPASVVDFIRGEGGIAVLAHPARYRGRWPEPEVLEALDGIEVWNARYDGRFLPSGTLLRQALRTRSARGRMLLLAGQDLHALTSHRLLLTSRAERETFEEFLAGLRSGNVRVGASPLTLHGGGAPTSGLALRVLSVLHAAYRGARGVRDRMLRDPEGSTGARS